MSEHPSPLECAVCGYDYSSRLPPNTVLTFNLKLVCAGCLAAKASCCANCGIANPSYWQYCAECSQAHEKGDGSFEARTQYRILQKRPNANGASSDDSDEDGCHQWRMFD